MVDHHVDRHHAEKLIEVMRTRLAEFYWGAFWGGCAWYIATPYARHFASTGNYLMRKSWMSKAI